MPIFRLQNDQLIALDTTRFDQHAIYERNHLQQVLKKHIDVLHPDILIVAEEFGDWDESRRRIDLLAIDKEARLVVIELKRTEDGGHMELQAIRYAAMVSTLTFERLVGIFSDYIEANGLEIEAREKLLDFLQWSEPDEDSFAQDVRVILASADFSKELTTSVLWLNDNGLDITCIRMKPYVYGNELLIDIQSVIPVPEASDYQIKIKEKRQRERTARTTTNDRTRFDLSVDGMVFPELSKRWLVYRVVKACIDQGVKPSQINEVISNLPNHARNAFQVFSGVLNDDDVKAKFNELDTGGQIHRSRRFFSQPGEFFHENEKTYVLTNQWGTGALETVDTLISAFCDARISYSKSLS
ncbi:hypothetical protein [Idiomarina sp. UBA3162]|uniref:hypothetical protein n=1 Tax=Idiomarina sp. UBA3162 TaxID=1946641 RepID=UPI000C99048E|nr:hypothetical protein [Idiomarina sp. UBA3162]MAD53266.1 hypothetical protein [Idiomarinaceae bacterium]|tara:strand:+ start:2894 stop:3961 length:1068 start_codon:yes stop_codon:yes gene_type:complete